jgi:hypothetical protein
MTRIAALIAGCLIAAGAPSRLASQTPADKPTYPLEGWRQIVLEGVSLSKEQQKQLETIAERYYLLMQAKQSVMTSATDSVKRATVRDIQIAQAADIEKMLTPAQRKVFTKNLDAWRAAPVRPRPRPSIRRLQR